MLSRLQDVFKEFFILAKMVFCEQIQRSRGHGLTMRCTRTAIPLYSITDASPLAFGQQDGGDDNDEAR